MAEYTIQTEGPLVVVTISSDFFTWVSKTRTFVTELSDLPEELLDYMNLKQGFYIKSERTGISKYFSFYKRILDPFDGVDIESWEYLSDDNIRCTLFND
jgi:hypothetical protein